MPSPGHHAGVNFREERVSKAALIGALLAVGLLDPGPSSAPRSPERMSSASLAQAEPPPLPVSAALGSSAPSSCTNPPRELRFEMIRTQAEAYSPPVARPVCLAVYRP